MKKHLILGCLLLLLLLSACSDRKAELTSRETDKLPTITYTQAPTVTEPIPDAGLRGVELTAPESLTVSPDAPAAVFTVTANGVCPDGAPEGGRACTVKLFRDGELIQTTEDFILTEGASLDFSVEYPFARYSSVEDSELAVELDYGAEACYATVPVDARNYPDEYYSMTGNDPYPYAITIFVRKNVVVVYGKDDAGEYTQPVKTLLCSTGLGTPTKGTYCLLHKYEWRALIHQVWGQYSTWITGDILIHSVPYFARSKNMLNAGAYNCLGQSVSAGCIRMRVRDCKWIYDYCPCGTAVTFTTDDLPKGIKKPKLQEIDLSSPYAGWDPTDPDPDNPWEPKQPSSRWKKAVPDFDDILTANTTLDKAGYEAYIKTSERFSENENKEEP